MGQRPTILIVDDDSDALLSLTRVLGAGALDVEILAATEASKASKMFASAEISVVVLDLSLDDTVGVESGFALLEEFLKADPAVRIVVLTGHGSDEFGVRSIAAGAANFLEKPADIDHLTALIVDGVRQCSLQRELRRLEAEKLSVLLNSTVVGKSSAMQELKEQMSFAASTAQPVLLVGETGTGKGLCAYAIHQMSKRSDGPFIRCAPNFGTPDIVASEIFGYVKGAFTGAEADNQGLLEAAKHGTFFLDEVDELPKETQIALLGVLQDRTYRPVGASGEMTADIRLISATNRDIDVCVKEGMLREDFFHRIAHERIEVPPLRIRLDDIPLLAEHFLLRLHQREETGVLHVDKQALAALKQFDWPGNIRQFQAVIEGAAYRAAYSRVDAIRDEHLKVQSLGHSLSEDGSPLTLQEQIEQFKHQAVEKALAAHEGNQSGAARALGIDRSTLRRILNR